MTTALQKAETDLNALEIRILIIEKRIDLHPDDNVISASAAEVLIRKADAISDALLEIYNRILHLSPPSMDDHDSILENWTFRIDTAVASLKDIIKSYPVRVTTRTMMPSVKLPEMQLPHFDGRYEDWPSFEDLFKATIDNNRSLSDAQKLQYLKSCVRNEASNLIKSFTITEQNYKEAWNLLTVRYNNKREIVYSLVKKLFNQQQLKTESITGLQALLNTTTECIRSLKVMGRPTDKWDDLLVITLVEKLDPDSKSEWAKSLTGTDPATFQSLCEFLEKHTRSLIARGAVTTTVKPPHPPNKPQQQKKINTLHSSFVSQCALCKEPHFLYQCKKLLQMDPASRISAVKQTSSCINCLREGHSAHSCNSKFNCKSCSKRHHSLLHIPQRQQGPTGDIAQQTLGANTSSTVEESETHVLLKTAIVNVKDSFGQDKPCRLLLDDGSEGSFITEQCANSLNLIKQKVNVLITGISASNAAQAQWKVTTKLWSRVHEASVDVELYVLPKVTGTLPRVSCNSTLATHLNDLQLADPQYHKPGEVDILLGADVVASIMREGRKQGPANSPIAQNSIFGWVLSGRVHVADQLIIRAHHSTLTIDSLVQRFWELEEVPNRKPLTKEEATCEKYFTQTTTRKADGRYVVKLPFHEKYASSIFNSIGETRALAERRLHQLERRFLRHPSHHEAYVAFMSEYMELGHMEPAEPFPSTTSTQAIYIPHHFVLKQDSTTTKLRVVFDASMKSTNGLSLNDLLMVGPTIQDDLFSLLLRFRLHIVALKADVEKMYRQYELHPDDRNYLRILWRVHPRLAIREYLLKTNTYGTGPAPFIATRCLQQLAEDEEKSFPRAAAVVKSDMYVDDLISGEKTTEEAKTLTKDIINLIGAGAMSIRKWCSNDEEVMKSIPPELRETGSELSFDDDSTIKALGIIWQPRSDSFIFKVNSNSTANTKRELLSEIAKTFDPLGWLSPITITAKILFQQLWQESYGWDDQLASAYQEQWTRHQQQLHLLSTLRIPRCVVSPNVTNHELHGFSDASEKAYAAAVYLRCTLPDGNVIVHLLTSRTKVAPLKQVSLPRLELCGALLLAETIDSTIQAIKIKCNIQCYSDSMIVLKWLASSSRRWKTFVANRVAAIQEVVPSDLWHHVRGEENPADLPSRGVSAEELIDSKLWWHGPEWLSTNTIPVTTSELNLDDVKMEERPQVILSHHSSLTVPFIVSWTEKFSTLKTLVTSTAVFRMFIKFIKNKNNPNQCDHFISVSERRSALHMLIKLTQAHLFHEEMKILLKKEHIPASSKLIKLTPYVDQDGIIRGGGRLEHARISEDSKHPIVLPKSSHLTNLIIKDVHERHYHGGNNLTCAALLQNYWIIGAKDAVRFNIRKCIRCRKVKASTMQQLMGSLPAGRVSPNRPFLHSGVDFAGPFQIKMRRGRGASCDKVYFAVFVCFSTKAVHLEAVTDLTSEAFISAFRRFTARRGFCSHMYSDCGTNFVGADRELRKLTQQLEEKFQHQFAQMNVTWHFNPPASPHQGGLWEAAVKSTKFHLRRIVGATSLTLEQFQTLLCNVEAIMNSRPLCSISSDPTDFLPLTPGHFLIGVPLTSIPEDDLMLTPQNRLTHWQTVQQMSQQFWNRWSSEYLSSLNQRFKWVRKEKNVEVGDLVVVKEDNVPPTRWKLARVIAVHPGHDGLVRKVTLRMVQDVKSTPVKYAELTRTIHKISPLLQGNEM